MPVLKQFAIVTLVFAFGLMAAIDAAKATTSICDSLSGNVVANCGFETGDFTSWTLSGNDVPLQLNKFYGVEGNDPVDATHPNSGNNQAFFADAAFNPIQLSQSVSTPGTMYTVSWYLTQDAVGTPAFPNEFTVTLGGVSVVSLTDVPVQGYTHYSYSVATTTPFSLLIFTLGDDFGQFLLDDISVVPSATVTPLPAALPLFAGGLGLLGMFTRRRKQKASAIAAA